MRMPESGVTVTEPRRVLERNSLRDLPEQWVVSESGVGPAEWPSRTVGNWYLRSHPTLPVIELHDSDAHEVGWLLGYPIDGGDTILRDGSRLQAGTSRGATRILDELGGRWVAVLARGAVQAVVPDAGGTMASVYCPRERIVASTPNLVPYLDGLDDNIPLIQTMTTTAPFGYLLGLTPRHGVRRLLPNHTLSLSSFETHRTWPMGDVGFDPDIDGQLERIQRGLRRTLLAASENAPCALPLTGGYDSRMLLACAWDMPEPPFVYTHEMLDASLTPDPASRRDVRIAARVAQAAGIDHHVVRAIPPTAEDLERWQFRTSCTISAPRAWRTTTTLRSIDRRMIRMLGQGGEHGRGHAWKPHDTPDSQLTPERVLQVAKATPSEETLREADRWLAQMPDVDSLTALNTLYLEQWEGAWGSMIHYADFAGPGFTMGPFFDRGVLQAFFTLPLDYQRSGRLPQDLIARSWPALLTVPFNRPSHAERIKTRVEEELARLRRTSDGKGR